MRTILIIAAAAVLPTAAGAVTISLGGVFGNTVATTPFSSPNRSFDATFAIPATSRANGNQVKVSYLEAGVFRQQDGYFNVAQVPGQRESFTLSLGDPFSFQALNIEFSADSFFTALRRNAVRFKTGVFALYDGQAVTTDLFGASRGPIVNPTGLRIFNPPASASGASALAVPETGTIAVLLAGCGLLGFAHNRRARS